MRLNIGQFNLIFKTELGRQVTEISRVSRSEYICCAGEKGVHRDDVYNQALVPSRYTWASCMRKR